MSKEHEEKMINLTRQMRHNQADLQSFLSDMGSWESDIKKKEEQLLTGNNDKVDSLPPVRNTIHKKKLKKKKKEKPVDSEDRKKKICGFDFRSWDKFDVDEALEEIDNEVKKETSSSEYETDEEWEMERKKHLAGKEKEKGNQHFKNEEYDLAVESYSRGMGYDATNAVLPANRAMALLKQQKYAAAELDCTSSISLDPLYVKAYLRRATARANMNKLKEAVDDYNRVLDLEPTNKLAESELERLQKEKERGEKVSIPSTLTDDERGLVKAIYKTPEERSKVPLKRIVIEEVGIETRKRNQQPLTEQSEITKKITEREGKHFDSLIANSQNHKIETKKQESSVHSPVLEFSDDNSKIKEIKPDVSARLNGDDGWNGIGEEKLLAKVKSNRSPSENAKVNGNQSDAISGNPKSSTKESSLHSGSEKIPGVPHNSFQFQTDFKLLKNKSDIFFRYFTAISPSHYPSLFGQFLDADILKTILNALLNHEHGLEVNFYEILSGLTHVKRFSMTAMFLSRKEKQSARELTDRLSSSNQCSKEELSSLRQKWDL